MSDAMLKIRNHHNPSCGDPPIVDGIANSHYIGYFENAFGEQWIFTLDHESGKAVLRGGDVGWNSEFEVIGGQAADLVLGNEELLWLQACWLAASKQLRGG